MKRTVALVFALTMLILVSFCLLKMYTGLEQYLRSITGWLKVSTYSVL